MRKLNVFFLLTLSVALLSCNKDDEVGPFSENDYGVLEIDFNGEKIKVVYDYLGVTSSMSETLTDYYASLDFRAPYKKEELNKIELGKKPLNGVEEGEINLHLTIYGKNGEKWASNSSQDLTKFYNKLESMKLVEDYGRGYVYEYKGSFIIEMERLDEEDDETKIAKGTYHIKYDSFDPFM